MMKMSMSIIRRHKAATLVAAVSVLVLWSLFAIGWIARGEYETNASGTHPQVGLIWSSDVDPTIAPGVAAPQWQLLIRTDTDQMYFKSGVAATGWTSIGVGPGGGTVTSVACGTNMTCTPSPIVAAGTVKTVDNPTFNSVLFRGGLDSITDPDSVFHFSQEIRSSGAVGGTSLVVSPGVDNLTISDSGTVFHFNAQTDVAGDINSTQDIIAAGTVEGNTSVQSDGDLIVGTTISYNNGTTPVDIKSGAGSPNGVVTAHKGSLYVDSTNATLYQNTDGVMAWTQVGGSSGATPFYDTILTPAALAGNTNDWNPGTLGQNTLILYNGGANLLTGLVGGSAGKIVTLMATQGNAQASIQNDDASSTAANRFLTSSGSPTSINVQGAHTFVYVGSESRWHIANTGVN
jgi:hypothetical protein